MKSPSVDMLILTAGVLAVSTAAIFIREADAPAIIVAMYRLAIASLPLIAISGVVAVSHRTDRSQYTRFFALNLLAGIALVLHMALWVASVQQTSIVTSVALVTTQPLWVALVSGPLLGEPPSRRTLLGIAIAGSGAMVMVANDLGAGGDTLRGDLFALIAAMLACAYFLVGRKARSGGQEWLPYVTVTYSCSAVALVLLALVAGEALGGYSTRTYVFMALLALIPQLIGHSALNRSLGYLPAVSVAIAVLGEPVGASLLGAIFLDETPTLLQLAGGLLVLTGVYVGLTGTTSTREQVAPESP